ncbi:MAG TPA: glycosyltransferase [Gammaproteobacteria bacterium]|nr:glycosyltransferase [Gammaproteobacteria bacterium]
MPARRILVLTSTYPRFAGDAGVPPFVHELTRRLAVWFEMHVLAPHAPGAATEEQLDGVSVHRFRYLPERWETLAYGGGMLAGLRRRPWRAAALLPFLGAEYLSGQRLVRQGFDLIHAHWAIPHGYLGAKFKDRRALICTSHGSDLLALGRWARPLQRKALEQADVVTVVSATLRDKALEISTGITPQIMPMGVDTRRFVPPAAAVRRAGLLYVGRLVPDKGVHVLLQAMARLATQGDRPGLRVVGGGPAEGSLRKLTRELGLQSQVEFLGPRANAELPPLYGTAEALVFPSLLGKKGQQEGMGLVPLEALACGCPVIASRLPAVTEVVQEGETGSLFTAGDAAGLAACLSRLHADPQLASRMAETGRLKVVARYDWDDVAAGYRDLYQRVLDRS